jgi:hypothetical protein
MDSVAGNASLLRHELTISMSFGLLHVDRKNIGCLLSNLLEMNV